MLWSTVIEYKENEDSPWEHGIAIGLSPGAHDFKHMITADGRRLDEVWDFRVMSHRGSFIVGE